MSIDAVITKIEFRITENGNTATLYLKDRPKRGNENSNGIAGQAALEILNPPSPNALKKYNGREIWGNSSYIYCGEDKIAERVGYTRLKWIKENKGASA